MSEASDKHDEQCANLKKAAAICEQRGQGLVDSVIALQAKIERLEKANARRKNLNAQMLMNAAESGNRNYLAEIEQLQSEVEELKTDLHYCNGVSDLAMKHRDFAETKVERLTAAIHKHKKEIELKIEGRIDPCPEDKSLWGVLKQEGEE